MTLWMLLGLLLGLPLGAAGLLAASRISGRRLTESARSRVAELADDARRRADDLLENARRVAENDARATETAARQAALEARQDAAGVREHADDQLAQSERTLAEAERRLAEAERRMADVEQEAARNDRAAASRDAKLDRRQDALDRKADELSRREAGLDDRVATLDALEAELGSQARDLRRDLAEVKRTLVELSGLTEEQAREAFLRSVEDECRAEAGEVVRRSVEQAREEAKSQARDVLLEAIQRYSAEQTAEHTVTTVHLADDTLKGRVIGREGRNIRSFEKATGVDVIIDDTPSVIGLSCFDPVRREVARLSLEMLIADGRIHPGRIEEVVAEAAEATDEQLQQFGNEAAHTGHVVNLPKPLLPILGRLHFRTSYGQNVLKHSLEVGFLAQIMAGELGLDPTLARRAGLLHDIGKALDHEAEGAHTEIGATLLRKLGEHEAVVNAAAAHHGDVPASTPYTPLVTAADAMSASRPGARKESLERYIKRLRDLEDLAADFKGVRQAYAIHAGREVRVIVDAQTLDDGASAKLARDIARRVEATLTFPGEIKVTVLRETRSIELAR